MPDIGWHSFSRYSSARQYIKECLEQSCVIVRFHGCRVIAVGSSLIVVQVYESHLANDAALHDVVVDFHGGNDREGHRLRERTSSEGGDEGDGAWQHCTLGIVVHHELRHDACVSVSACRRPQGTLSKALHRLTILLV